MQQHIVEVSDVAELSVDVPVAPTTPQVRVVKGEPSDAELAAVLAVLCSSAAGRPALGPQGLNQWGHPVDRLRYQVFSWQQVTLVERTKLRR